MRHPFATYDDDHCETGAECFADILRCSPSTPPFYDAPRLATARPKRARTMAMRGKTTTKKMRARQDNSEGIMI
jgi:hypothetical protein